MNGLGIAVYTDEDVDPDLATQLVSQGYDVLSCHAAGRARQKITDHRQLEFATANGRAILVHNIADYADLAHVWASQSRTHHGIIMVEQTIALSELIRRTKLHLDTVTPQAQYNATLYLIR